MHVDVVSAISLGFVSPGAALQGGVVRGGGKKLRSLNHNSGYPGCRQAEKQWLCITNCIKQPERKLPRLP